MEKSVHNFPNAKQGYGVKKKLLKKWIYDHKKTQPYVAKRLNMPVEAFKEKINNKGTFNREQLKALIYLMGAWDAFHVIYFPSKRQRRKVYWQVFGQYREKEKLNDRNEKIKR